MNMKKFPKIRYPSDPATDGLHDGDVVVTEKLDGANFRFTWDEDGTLHVGTRNVVYEDAPNNENVPNAFGHAIEYVQRHAEPERVPEEVSNYTLFGEAMHRHSLDYEDIEWKQPHKGSPHAPLDSSHPNVVIFDVYDDIAESWLDWPAVTSYARDLGLETAPVLERGDPEDLDFEVPEESMFGGPPEGIVARRVDGTVRAKKVTEEFSERKGDSSMDRSQAQSDAAEFVAAFVTPQRIEKQAHKLVDEGEYDELKMEMMEDLPREVLKDVMAEEGWNLLTSGGFEAEWDDEFKSQVRSRASKTCARVLKQEVQSF